MEQLQKQVEGIKLRFDKLNGLVPAVVQDVNTNEILMFAYMNEEAWQKTLETGRAHFYSRSRNQLWMKGKESGHTQEVKKVLVDCDEDAVVLKVYQNGNAACHTGYNSCFFRQVKEDGSTSIIKEEKVFDPDQVYSKK